MAIKRRSDSGTVWNFAGLGSQFCFLELAIKGDIINYPRSSRLVCLLGLPYCAAQLLGDCNKRLIGVEVEGRDGDGWDKMWGSFRLGSK